MRREDEDEELCGPEMQTRGEEWGQGYSVEEEEAV